MSDKNFGDIEKMIREMERRGITPESNLQKRDVERRKSQLVKKEQSEKKQANQQQAVSRPRVKEDRRDDDQVSDQKSISLEDVDKAIIYQFENVFDMNIKQNGELFKVPIIYDTQERWTWARKNQDLKSLTDRVQLPLIVFTRDSVTRRQEENQPVFMPYGREGVFEVKWDRKNRYDNFAVLNDRHPVKQVYKFQTPRYLDISYSFNIYTEYMFQTNKLLEELTYYSNEYWGDASTGRLFKVNVNSFSTSIEAANEARYIDTNFTVEVDGYIIPRTMLDKATPTKKERTYAQVKTEVSLGERTVTQEKVNELFKRRR